MTKSKFAILYAQESMFWQLCSDNNWPAGLQERYRAFCKKVEEAANSFSNSLNIEFHGVEQDEDISHHDIDKALKAAFKSKVSTDSESGCFFAYCNTKHRKDITTWLTKNFPTLDFSSYVVDADSVQNPYFGNWNEAEAFCKKKGLKVTMPKEANVDTKALKEVSEIEKQIAELEAKKNGLISSL